MAANKENTPRLNSIRNIHNKNAIVLLHGFCGDHTTWDKISPFIASSPLLKSWDIFSIAYASSKKADFPCWSSDPSLPTLAKLLSTTFSTSPLASYCSIAIVAHSMGGLIAQRSILDDTRLRSRISHLFCLGTPSMGLGKATLAALAKRQTRDMSSGSKFIKKLRKDWASESNNMHFVFYTLQGERDDFVPHSSSLSPFTKDQCKIIKGDHLQMIRPDHDSDECVQFLIDNISCTHSGIPPELRIKIAHENSDLQCRATQLLPQAHDLDPAALVDLALALDALSRRDDAIRILEQHANKKSSDALGTLAGRLKRKWISQRIYADMLLARETYREGLSIAQKNEDHQQIFYHAINIAFLDYCSTPTNQKAPQSVIDFSNIALSACINYDKHNTDPWAIATLAEAHLLLGDVEKSSNYYKRAMEMSESIRAAASIRLNATEIARRSGCSDTIKMVKALFTTPLPVNA